MSTDFASKHPGHFSSGRIQPAAQPFFQPRLTVNQPGDAYEREADRVADQLMRMRDGEAPAVQRVGITPVSGVQRKCAECEKEEQVQRKETAGAAGGHAAPPIVTDVLRSGGGQPLDGGTRQFMESRFGQDFSRVRVHVGGKAAESAAAVQAKAYTSGSNVVFGAGQYSPHTADGRHLLAHELTHVQQQEGSPAIQRAALHTGRILNEGSCEHLACNSRWACDDPDGVLCPTGTRNHGQRKRPLFTCDVRCDNNIPCGTNYMAIPHSRWRGVTGGQCNQDLVICANNSFTHGTVRDRSEGEHWEVSPGIFNNLGVAGDTRDGAIYPNESDPAFLRDSRCRPAARTADAGTALPTDSDAHGLPHFSHDNPSDQIEP